MFLDLCQALFNLFLYFIVNWEEKGMKKHTLLLACAMRILLNLIALPAWGRGTASAALGCFRMQHKCAALFPVLPIYLSCHVCPIRPCGAPTLEGKAAIRGYHPLKRRRSRLFESIRSPSTVIPSEAEGSLLHCRHMHTCALTQTTPWCFLFRLSLAHDLLVCKKDPSTSVGMTFKGNG